MQDQAGVFQRLYLKQLETLKENLANAQERAEQLGNPTLLAPVIYASVADLAETIEALGNYVTVLEEELRRATEAR